MQPYTLNFEHLTLAGTSKEQQRQQNPFLLTLLRLKATWLHFTLWKQAASAGRCPPRLEQQQLFTPGWLLLQKPSPVQAAVPSCSVWLAVQHA